MTQLKDTDLIMTFIGSIVWLVCMNNEETSIKYRRDVWDDNVNDFWFDHKIIYVTWISLHNLPIMQSRVQLYSASLWMYIVNLWNKVVATYLQMKKDKYL